MIYFGSFFAGIINGLFASGAGQILVFIFIFILKLDAHKSRVTSICMMGIVTIITLIRYLKQVDISYTDIAIVAIIGLVCGNIGNKIMKKISPMYLNIISGVLLVVFSVINLVRG